MSGEGLLQQSPVGLSPDQNLSPCGQLTKNLLIFVKMRIRWVLPLGLVVVWAQGVGIGILIPDSAAILHLESDRKGLLVPRLSTTQRDAIQNPPWGLVIFNTTDSVLQYYNGRCWLNAYQESCEDCNFTLSLSASSGTIDHVNTDSVQVTVTVTQTAGVPQSIALQLYSVLPPYVSYTFLPTVLTGSGSSTLTIRAEPIAPGGTYPIIVQAVCGRTIKNAVFTLTIDSCYYVQILNSTTDYHLTNQNPQLPTGVPICVVVRTHPGIEVSATSVGNPAFTTGSLHPQSVVALIHEGAFLGKGGAGAVGGAAPDYSNPGGDGGDAMHITCRTHLYLRNGYLFGGGGGGASVGITWSFTVPIVGWTYSFDLGVGGGGGAGNGAGGTSATPPPLFVQGQDGTGGLTGVGGRGGRMYAPITFPLGPVTVVVTPTLEGGDGGGYGYPGTTGYFYACGQASVSLPWPIGTISFPIGCYPPAGVTFQPGGQPGYAVRRLGGAPLFPYPDAPYLTNFIKGRIGP